MKRYRGSHLRSHWLIQGTLEFYHIFINFEFQVKVVLDAIVINFEFQFKVVLDAIFINQMLLGSSPIVFDYSTAISMH
jgi:hypothetical protein